MAGSLPPLIPLVGGPRCGDVVANAGWIPKVVRMPHILPEEWPGVKLDPRPRKVLTALYHFCESCECYHYEESEDGDEGDGQARRGSEGPAGHP